MKIKKTLNWAIIGAGNGGQSMAGQLGIMGYPVKLYDVSKETIDVINKKGGIKVDGAIEGFGKVKLASTNIKEVIDGVDMIIVVLPSIYHGSIAKACAPHLKDGQTIFLHPSATFGAFEFRKVLDDEKCIADVTIAEAQTLLYACRTIEAMLHPAPTILNTGRIDSQEDWLYYYDGVTSNIGNYVQEMDKERIKVGKALGLDLKPVIEWYNIMYGACGDNLSDVVRANKSYDGIKGQKTLYTRYLLEDVPNALVPMVSLGKKFNVDVTKMETIVNLVKGMLGDKINSEGRTLESLGLSDYSKEQFLKYVSEES